MSEATDIEHIRREAKAEALREFARHLDGAASRMKTDPARVPQEWREGVLTGTTSAAENARTLADRIEAGDE